MKVKKVRIGTITDDLAEKMEHALENGDSLEYRLVSPRLLDVYTEK